MSSNLVRFNNHALLTFQAGTSDKFYEAWLVEANGVVNIPDTVVFHWGRRGTKGQYQVQECPSQAMARAIFDKKVKEKAGKGYADNPVAPSGLLGAVAEQAIYDAQGAAEKPKPQVQPTTGVVTVESVQINLQDFVSNLLETNEVTADQANTRNDLAEQMNALRDLMLEAEGAFELADTIYRSRL